MIKFRQAQSVNNCDINPRVMKCIVHNFSSYSLSQVEINVLSYGLDHRIPTNINRKSIRNKFKLVFMPGNEINKVKTKLPRNKNISAKNTCEKC